jgi:hypothetical protein
MHKIESEKNIDKKLVNSVKALGGVCIKNETNLISGMPDRLCLMPGGKMFFVEVKTTGKNLWPIQEFTKIKLQNLGFEVYVLEHEHQISDMLKDYIMP